VSATDAAYPLEAAAHAHALDDSVDPIDPVQFRTALGRFATGVTVVTCRVDGADHAMTANSLTSVSLEPPLVLVCVERETRFHEAILTATHWGVSVLGANARGAATWLATRGRPLAGQLDPVAHRRSSLTGVALLDEALAWFEVRTTAVHDGGDHRIVVGEVVGLTLAEDPPPALTFFRGRYGHLD
jgi:flavin reductase (DIM6/NTAB) family NADH-FMN oxidoreductase RutF